jgi:hypothetical protein
MRGFLNLAELPPFFNDRLELKACDDRKWEVAKPSTSDDFLRAAPRQNRLSGVLLNRPQAFTS